MIDFDIKIVSKKEDYTAKDISNLEEAGLYGFFRLRVNDVSYGFYLDELPTEHKNWYDADLYYWVKGFLNIATLLGTEKYGAIRDLENVNTWIEMKLSGETVEISIVKDKSEYKKTHIVSHPFEKWEYGDWNKRTVPIGEFLIKLIDSTEIFLKNAKEILAEFSNTSSHKEIERLVAGLKN